MTPDAFDRARRADRRRLVLLALFGYAYIGVLVLGLTVVTGLLLATSWRAAAWIPGIALALVLNTLRVRPYPPGGIYLRRGEAAPLFRMIGEVRAALDAPGWDAVAISLHANATAAEFPRFGALAGRRFLAVGFLLLCAVPEPEVRAILAHEFAHFSHRHGRRMGWAARLGTAWSALAYGSSRAFRVLFFPFFRWYLRLFAAAFERARRGHEYESDRMAADHVGADVMARALVRSQLASLYLERVIWPSLMRESAQAEQPPRDAATRAAQALSGSLDHPAVGDWLRSILEERALGDDSHPSVANRLRALRQPHSPGDVDSWLTTLRSTRSTASSDTLLGARERVAALSQQLDEVWAAGMVRPWGQLRADVAVWQSVDPDDTQSGHQAWARARWAASCEAPDVALPLLLEEVRRRPDRAEARLLAGQLLLEEPERRQWELGREMLEQVLQGESGAAVAAADTLRRYYARAHRPADVTRCELRARRLHAAYRRSLRERERIEHADTLRAYPLPAAMLADLQARVRSHPEIRRAFLVEKRLKHFPGTPLVMLAIDVKAPRLRLTERVALRVAQSLAAEVIAPPEVHFVVLPVQQRGRLRRRLRRLPGATIYDPRDPTGSAKPPTATGEWHGLSRLARMFLYPSLKGVLAAFGSVALLLVILAIVILETETLTDLRARAQAYPTDAFVQRDFFWALIDSGRTREALVVSPQVRRVNPRDASIRSATGWLLGEAGRWDEALAVLDTALQLEPNHRVAYRRRGWVLYKMGRFEESLAAYRLARRANPEDAIALFEPGLVLVAAGEVDRGVHLMHAAIRLEPGNARFRCDLGGALASVGRFDDALATFRECRAIDSSAVRADSAIAWIEAHRDR